MEWLKELFDRIMSIFPRILIVSPNEVIVRTTAIPFFPAWTRTLTPGWYLLWELFQAELCIETPSQVIDLRAQSARTLDRVEVVVSGAIQFRITDGYKAMFCVQDIDKAIQTVALGIILEFITTHRWDEDLHKINNLKTQIGKGLREASSGWGVKIERVYITDIGRTRNIRILMKY